MRAGAAALLLAGLAWSAPATRASDMTIDWGQIESPYLREVVFDFARQRYFSAIGHLLSERFRSSFKQEKTKSEVMLAYAYLAYGMHADAGAVLQQLPPDSMDNEQRNSVLLELANTHYQRGDLNGALKAVQKVSPNISADLTDQKLVFEAILLAQQQQLEQAVALLQKVRGESEWAALGYFNLGTALLRLNRRDEAEQALKRVTAIKSDDFEIAALRDRAHFVLGFSALRAQAALQAKSYFQQVSLDSPFSNRALLGVGLAHEALLEHKQSLAAWLELSGRNAADRAVLDALLAVPYAYAQLGAREQAVQQYKSALDVYQKELNSLEEAMTQVRSGVVIAAIVEQLNQPDIDARGDEVLIPVVPEARYLSGLYESHSFQRMLHNYLDLTRMQKQLGDWAKSIYSVPNMSETFTKVYADQIAAKQSKLVTAAEEMKQYLTQLALADMEKRRTLLLGYVKEAFFNLGITYDRGAER